MSSYVVVKRWVPGFGTGFVLGFPVPWVWFFIQFGGGEGFAADAGRIGVCVALLGGLALIFVRGWRWFGAGLTVGAGLAAGAIFLWFLWAVSQMTF
jgi:hypothetical protein